MNYNKTIIGGRIVNDLELKATQSGTNYLNFTVAVSKRIKDNEITAFVDCTAFSKTAENICAFFKKGSNILIEGEIATRTVERDGKKTKYTSIEVFRFEFVDKRVDVANAPLEQQKEAAEQQAYEAVGNDDDLPFN